MADTAETTSDDAPRADDEAPQGGEAGTTPDPQGGPDDPRVAELSRENARWRRRVRDLEAAEAERGRAELSDLERARAERDDAIRVAEQAQRDAALVRARADVIAAAAQARFVDPDAAWAFVRDQALDEAFDPKAAVKQLASEKKYLVQPTSAGSAASPARSEQERDRKETPEERRARIYGAPAMSAFIDPSAASKNGGGVFLNQRVSEGVEAR